MTTMSLARIAQVLQRDFRSTANQLRQEGQVVRGKSQSCVDAAYTLDRLATTVKDVDPNLLLAYHELVAENPDRVRHAELLRQVAFTGKNQDGERISLRVHKRPHWWCSASALTTGVRPSASPR